MVIDLMEANTQGNDLLADEKQLEGQTNMQDSVDGNGFFADDAHEDGEPLQDADEPLQAMGDYKVTAATVIRTCVLLLALVNQVLAAIGKSPLPFDSEELTQAISTAITAVASCVAWWKNNSFTKAALVADDVMQVLKQEK